MWSSINTGGVILTPQYLLCTSFGHAWHKHSGFFAERDVGGLQEMSRSFQVGQVYQVTLACPHHPWRHLGDSLSNEVWSSIFGEERVRCGLKKYDCDQWGCGTEISGSTTLIPVHIPIRQLWIGRVQLTGTRTRFGARQVNIFKIVRLPILSPHSGKQRKWERGSTRFSVVYC